VALLFEDHGRIVEGAGGLALAGLFKDPGRFQGRRVVLVASGGNISPEVHHRLVSRG
jgi:threonine dehydratase